MNSLDFLVMNVHKIIESESLISSIRHEMDPNTKEVISRTYFSSRDVHFNVTRNDKLCLNYQRFQINELHINCIRLMDNEYFTLPKPSLNIPTMIRCQNCETNFPTKYQYQRHQCEFNVEKVVLKPELDVKDIDNSIRVKYVCQICERQFVSRTNLERHESSHEKNQENICEHCSKKFVSENRLRIHKENHCKKAGDISKFYRSDVTVWKCKKCHEVFSSLPIANYHIVKCSKLVKTATNYSENSMQLKMVQDEMKNTIFFLEEDNKDNVALDDNEYIEKILTEVLFQCEFCNRTYSEKNQLLIHQRKHTTSKNYECSSCFSVFDSYATAVQHWLKKCTEYVNVFFLPRFTYCEYCDRPFKSHELLYTHKIKKKHYTSKIHVGDDNTGDQELLKMQNAAEKPVDSKEVLSKLIEDVLKTLDVPINRMKNSAHFSNQISALNGDHGVQNPTHQENVDVSLLKNENIENSQHSMCNGDVGEKKKRGRKRKWLQRTQQIRPRKTYTSTVEKGFKYQCERCVNMFDAIADLDAHREKEHASNFSCEECGQVWMSSTTFYRLKTAKRYENLCLEIFIS